jgi:hypothetical protein
MRIKPSYLIILTSIFLLLFAPVVFAQVEIRVRVMEASNVGSGIDSSLKDLHGQLGSLFNFNSYRLLKDENVNSHRQSPPLIREDRWNLPDRAAPGRCGNKVKISRDGRTF